MQLLGYISDLCDAPSKASTKNGIHGERHGVEMLSNEKKVNKPLIDDSFKGAMQRSLQ